MDQAFHDRVLSWWNGAHPSTFEIILGAACEANLRSLRCEPLGVETYRLWKTGTGDSERFEALLAERLPVTVFVTFGVESSQLAFGATEQS